MLPTAEQCTYLWCSPMYGVRIRLLENDEYELASVLRNGERIFPTRLLETASQLTTENVLAYAEMWKAKLGTAIPVCYTPLALKEFVANVHEAKGMEYVLFYPRGYNTVKVQFVMDHTYAVPYYIVIVQLYLLDERGEFVEHDETQEYYYFCDELYLLYQDAVASEGFAYLPRYAYNQTRMFEALAAGLVTRTAGAANVMVSQLPTSFYPEVESEDHYPVLTHWEVIAATPGAAHLHLHNTNTQQLVRIDILDPLEPAPKS